jgi:hypothetical protein
MSTTGRSRFAGIRRRRRRRRRGDVESDQDSDGVVTMGRLSYSTGCQDLIYVEHFFSLGPRQRDCTRGRLWDLETGLRELRAFSYHGTHFPWFVVEKLKRYRFDDRGFTDPHSVLIR